MILPSRTAVFVAIVLSLPLLLAGIIPAVVEAAIVADLLLFALIFVEGRRLKRCSVTVSRRISEKISLGRKTTADYVIRNHGDRPLAIRLRETFPAEFVADVSAMDLLLEAGTSARFQISLTPGRRGQFRFSSPEVTIGRPRGFAVLFLPLAVENGVSVYPDLESLYEYDTLRRSRHLVQIGIHRFRQISRGREFEKLREYLPDDDFRDINWNATARIHRPVTEIFQAEKSQDIMLCLDSGRMMGDRVGDVTAFDKAMDAAMMIGFAAARQGDKVGVAVFSDRVHVFTKPRAGTSSFHRMIDTLISTEPDDVYTSHLAIASALRAVQKRRSLVFLFTDINDVQLASDLVKTVPLIAQQHVVVIVSLRDPLLRKTAEGGAEAPEDVARVIAARELCDERDARVRELRRRGVRIVESAGDRLSIAAVNAYLDLTGRQAV